MIGQKTSTAKRPHRVQLQNPGPPIADGDGSYTQTWTDLAPPNLFVAIEAMNATNLERAAAGTVLATNVYLITAPYHPQVTTQTRILFNGRTFNVTGIVNLEERNVELVLTCAEVIT